MNSKYLEIPILIKYREDNNYVYQEFVFLTKKTNFKYLKDNRYVLNRNLMDTIKNFSLVKYGLIFYELSVQEDKIVARYSKGDYKDCHKYFIVCGEVPPQMGCHYCEYKKDRGNYLLCAFQDDKVYTRELKKCRFFSQKEK